MWTDWKEKIKENPTVSKWLLWDYDYDNIDWQDMRLGVVERVLELGNTNDFYAIFRLYGGIDGVRETLKEVRHLSVPAMDIACVLFDLKKEELGCYVRKQLRENYLNCSGN